MLCLKNKALVVQLVEYECVKYRKPPRKKMFDSIQGNKRDDLIRNLPWLLLFGECLTPGVYGCFIVYKHGFNFA